MPIASVKLRPGVDVERTITLNEAGISQTQLCRFKDGLVQSVGGWVQWYSQTLAYTPRVMLSFTDLNGNVYTAVGTDGDIYVINNNAATDLTPVSIIENVAPEFSTVNGSSTVTINASGTTPTAGLGIFINTPVSVGGLIIQGGYNIITVTGASYTITAASNATSTVTNGGAVAVYTTTIGTPAINVLLNNHRLTVGSQWTEKVPTAVGGLTISGNYLVTAVVDVNNFTIDALSNATSTASASENSGLVQTVYYLSTVPPVLPNYGYGVGGYGLGGYGQGSIYTPIAPITAQLWTLDHFGETLLACPGNGPIYSWTPGLGETTLQIVATAPSVNGGIFVAMPAQILVAWASSINGVQQPNLVQWSDQLNYASWVPTVTNQAGNATIPTGSRIVGGIQTPNQALIFTDIDVYAMNYLGGNAATEQLVFGFNQIAKGCGLIGPRAVGVLNAEVFWLSQGQFMTLSNGGVEAIPCPIWDIIFQDLDQNNLNKIIAAPNSLFNEMAWYYPSVSGGTGENDSYVKFNTLENAWDYGKLIRTAWQDQSPAGYPLGGSTGGYIYQHEVGTSAAGAPLNWSFSTGVFMISEGDDMSFVDWILTDWRYGLINNPASNQNVTVTVNSYRYANDTPIASQPLVCTPTGNGELSTRMRGRAMQLVATGGGFARLGNLRYRWAPDGKYG
jgi:hypothetical protein